MGKVIGIDLGTTNSCVAVLEGGEPEIIPNSEGGRTTPSVVSFTKEGERVVGEAARRQQAVNAARTVLSIKREMGTDYRVKIDGKAYTPQEISAMILQKLRRDAEDARRYEAQDKARKEASGIRNEAEKLIYETEQALGRDKTISHEDKKKVKDDISALRKAVNKTKPESITTEQAAEIARLAEALKQSAKAIRTEE